MDTSGTFAGIILSVDVVEAASGSIYGERHRRETENRNRTFRLQGKRNFRAHRNLSRHTKSKVPDRFEGMDRRGHNSCVAAAMLESRSGGEHPFFAILQMQSHGFLITEKNTVISEEP